MSRAVALLTSALVLLPGCQHFCDRGQITLPQLKESMLQDLHDMDEDIGFTDLIRPREDVSRKRAEAVIWKRQCLYANSNPPLVFVNDVTLTAKGTWATKSGLEGSASPKLTFNVETANEQTVTLPLKVFTLRALPDIYLESELARLKELKDLGDSSASTNSKKNTNAKKKKGSVFSVERKDVLDAYTDLKDRVTALQQNVDLNSPACAKVREREEGLPDKQAATNFPL